MILSGNAGVNGCRGDKIQLVNCPHKCMNCKLVLYDINRLFNDSEHYQSSKEYHLSILCLKRAFLKTYEITEAVEQECARVFRFTIMESLENIHHELKRMANGLFSKSRHKENFLLAKMTLDELRQAPPSDNKRNMLHSADSRKNEELKISAV